MLDYNTLNCYARLCLDRNALLNNLNNLRNTYSNYIYAKQKVDKCKPIIYFGWKILALVIISIIIYIILMLGKGKRSYQTHTFYRAFAPSIMFICKLAFLTIAILLIVSIILRISDVRKYKKYKKIIPYVISNIEETERSINSISRELASYDLLPVCYWHLGHYIIQYILNRRADTIKEAINLYETEYRQDMQFRNQMEALNRINRQLYDNKMVNAAGFAMVTSSILWK